MYSIVTHNNYHLGDNLIHLSYLRRVAQQNPDTHFRHGAHKPYLKQLELMVEDVDNIELFDAGKAPPGSIDSWKNRNGGFYGHPKRNDWIGFHLEFFDKLSKDIGVNNPIKSPNDLLMDCPAINRAVPHSFDFLVINSPPQSGQISVQDFDPLIGKLIDCRYRIVTTAGSGYDVPCTMPLPVTAIGAISLRCRFILGNATGPVWPTFNVWNRHSVELRLLLLEPERIYFPNVEHVASIAEALESLEDRGLI
jgi:hypothetical protein